MLRFHCVIRWAVLCQRFRKDESGQAMVESAIVIPLMVFLILGVVQLVMMQHARIMTEYAAFNAARAGIVWNGDKIIMENAAIISLLPTYEGLVDKTGMNNPEKMLERILQRALLYQVNRRIPQAADVLKNGANKFIEQLNGGSNFQEALKNGVDDFVDKTAKQADTQLQNAITGALGGSSNESFVKVEILNPSMPALGTSEVDFDDVCEVQISSVAGALGLPGGSDCLSKNRLTIRVRYFYMMRVPFANWVIQQAWLAATAGQKLFGAIWSPRKTEGATGFSSTPDSATIVGADSEAAIVRELAKQGIHVIPLRATYTMRMQSNLYRQSFQVN